MFFIDFLFVILITILLTLLLGSSYRSRGTSAFLFFVIILLLGTWAIGAYINPIGPLIMGVSWLSYLLVGLIIALLMTALAAAFAEPPQNGGEDDKLDLEIATGTAFNVFFWILFIILVIAIILSYL